MDIAVLDSNGAGIGQSVVKKLKKELNTVNIIALGTNTFATSNMVKSGATVGISGEKAIYSFLKTNEIHGIIAPISILYNGTLDSEVSPLICKAFFNVTATKYILPLKQNNIYIPGTQNLQIKDIITEIVYNIITNYTNLNT